MYKSEQFCDYRYGKGRSDGSLFGEPSKSGPRTGTTKFFLLSEFVRYHFLVLPNGIALAFVTNLIQLSIRTWKFKYIILLEAKRSTTASYHTLKGAEVEATLRSETTNS